MSTVRDSNGKWLDTSVFRQEAIRFLNKGFYCEHPFGTPDWIEYWREQQNRCLYGYEVEGQKITGHHYFYLNFVQIDRVEYGDEDEDDEDSLANKIVSFPDFWDGDYNFFWSLEIARNGICSKYSLVNSTEEERIEWRGYNKQLKHLEEGSREYLDIKSKRDALSQKILDRLGLYVKPHLDYLAGGHHFVIGKSRRKGYSYKNAAIIANIYNTVRNKLTLIGAFEKKFMDETMSKVWDCINFVNENTGFAKNTITNKKDFVKSGFIENINGIDVEKGYQSRIDASRTFKDKPDAMRGVDAYFIMFEEAGAFDNLANAFNATSPSLTAGSKITGQICIVGTSGDLKKGSVDYAHMFYNPLAYGLMPFVNTWDKGQEYSVCGFFHPCTWNMEGFYDKQGNSDVKAATEWEEKNRVRILKNGSLSLLNKHLQEFPLCPADAFIVATTSFFPVDQAKRRLQYLRTNKIFEKQKWVKLVYNGSKVEAIRVDKSKVEPIDSLYKLPLDIKSCVVIYEDPIPDVEKKTYRIGYDPVSQDEGTSLGAIVVYRTATAMNPKPAIVAEYIGRPETSEELDNIAEKLAILYGATIMVENNISNTINYFKKIKRLDLLSLQPNDVISKYIKNSRINRTWGCAMTTELKRNMLDILKNKLLEVVGYDQNGDPIYFIDTIMSPRMLDEIANFNDKDNFDYISALIMVMIENEQIMIGKPIMESRVHSIAKQLQKKYGVMKIR